MKIHSLSLVLLNLCLIMLIINVNDAIGQSVLYPQSTNVTLYRDGVAHCKQQFLVGSLVPQIIIPLFSDSPQNILLLDENSTAVDYKISGTNLTAYTLGASSLLVEYDTMQLTSKEGEVWTFTTQYPYNMTLLLPSNSTVVYLSEIPYAIETANSAITMNLPAGYWEISYILPVSTPINPTSTPDNSGQSDLGLKTEYIVLIIIAVGVFVVLGFILFKRKGGPKVGRILKENPQLSKDDQAVIQYLMERDGKAFEAELREKFPDMPRTSLWRLVRRLERLDIVEVKKIGLENQVQLKK